MNKKEKLKNVRSIMGSQTLTHFDVFEYICNKILDKMPENFTHRAINILSKEECLQTAGVAGPALNVAVSIMNAKPGQVTYPYSTILSFDGTKFERKPDSKLWLEECEYYCKHAYNRAVEYATKAEGPRKFKNEPGPSKFGPMVLNTFGDE